MCQHRAAVPATAEGVEDCVDFHDELKADKRNLHVSVMGKANYFACCKETGHKEKSLVLL